MKRTRPKRFLPGLTSVAFFLVGAWVTTVSADVTTIGHCKLDYEQCLSNWKDDRFAVRLRDFDSPVVRNFPPIGYFPTSATNRVSATLHRYEEPRIIRVGTVIEGLDYNEFATCPIASARNRIATRITAGERYDPKTH